MGVVDDELSEETQAYRASQLEKWDFLIAQHADYLADAQKHTKDYAAASAAAGKYVRGSVRVFVLDLLSRVSPSELPEYLRRMSPTWPDTTEVLLGEVVVPQMVVRSFPHRQQAQQLDELTVAVAADNARWGKALDDFAEFTGQTIRDIGAVGGDVARTVAWVPVILAGALGIGAAIAGVAYVFKRA